MQQGRRRRGAVGRCCSAAGIIVGKLVCAWHRRRLVVAMMILMLMLLWLVVGVVILGRRAAGCSGLGGSMLGEPRRVAAAMFCSSRWGFGGIRITICRRRRRRRVDLWLLEIETYLVASGVSGKGGVGGRNAQMGVDARGGTAEGRRREGAFLAVYSP